MNFITIKTSTNDIDVATEISNVLLNKKLSPCVQIEKECTVKYLWNNEIVNDKEHIIRIKTISLYRDDVFNIIMLYHNL